MFYQKALGTSGTFYDFSMPDQTVADVLGQELAQVQAVHPDLVTVWLSTADIVDGTDPATYGAELRQLVRTLRRQGTTVLVADAVPPALESAFDVCTRRFGGCSTADPRLTSGAPSPGAPASAVTAYDGTIASVARQTGALLVDVHSVLARALQGGGVGSILTPDGTSLSEQGAALVARAFFDKLPASFTKPH
jgi:lysophospholipase L1-like esterase